MRSAFYENALKKQGVEWTYTEKLPIQEIDVARSLRNQARLETPLDDDLVEAYVRAFKSGDDFPPLVAWRPGKGRWTLIDGNQRLAALTKMGRKTCEVYLVDTQDEMVADRMTWTFNNLVNGKRLTDEEVLAHAVSWVTKYNRGVKEAADEWGVPKWRINRQLRLVQGRSVLDRHNIQHQRVTDDTLEELIVLAAAGEDVLALAAQTVSDCGLTHRDTKDLVKSVRGARTAAEKIEAINKFAASDRAAARRAETKGGTVRARKPLPRTQLVAAIKRLHWLLFQYDKPAIKPVAEEYKETRELVAEAIDRLRIVFLLPLERKVAQ